MEKKHLIIYFILSVVIVGLLAPGIYDFVREITKKPSVVEQYQEQIATIVETKKDLRQQMSEKQNQVNDLLKSLSGDLETLKLLSEQEKDFLTKIKNYEIGSGVVLDYDKLFTQLRDELKLKYEQAMKI